MAFCVNWLSCRGAFFLSFLGGVYGFIEGFHKIFGRPQIEMKVFEFYHDRGLDYQGKINPESNFFLFNISLVNTGKKDLYPKKWSAFIGYKNKNPQKILILPARQIYFRLKDFPWDTKKIKKRLKSEDISFLDREIFFKRDRSYNGYLLVLEENPSQVEKFEKIIFELEDFSGKIYSVEIFRESFEGGTIFNDSIWEKFNN